MNVINKILNPPIELLVFKIYTYWLIIIFIVFLFFAQNMSNISSVLVLNISVSGLFVLRYLRRDIKIPKLATYIFVLFLFFSIITTIFSIDPYSSFISLLSYIAIFTIFIISFDLFRDIRLIKWFLGWILFIGLIFSIYALFHYISGYDTRLTGTLLDPDTAAGFLLIIIPISLYFLFITKKTLGVFLNIVLSSIFIVSFYFTLSRGAYIAFIIEIIFLTIVFIKYYKTYLKRLLSVFILSLILILLISHVGLNSQVARVSLNRVISSVTAGTSLSVVDRVDVYIRSLDIVSHYPIFGTGLGTFGDIFAKYQNIPWVYFTYTHNQYLQIFVEEGIIGGLIFLSFFIYILYLGVKNIYKNRLLKYKNNLPSDLVYIFLFVGIAGSMAHVVIDYDWESKAILLLLFIFIGVFMHVRKENIKALGNKLSLLMFIILLLSIVISIDIFYSNTLFNKGVKAYNNFNLKLASSYFQSSIQYNPYNYDTYIWESSNNLLLRKYNLAISELFKSKKLSPYNPEIPYKIGQAYIQEGKHKMATKYLSKSYNFNKYSDPKYVLLLAENYSYLKDTKKSIQLYKQAISKYFPLDSTYNDYQGFYKLNGVDTSLSYIYLNLYVLTKNKSYYNISRNLNKANSVSKKITIVKK